MPTSAPATAYSPRPSGPSARATRTLATTPAPSRNTRVAKVSPTFQAKSEAKALCQKAAAADRRDGREKAQFSSLRAPRDMIGKDRLLHRPNQDARARYNAPASPAREGQQGPDGPLDVSRFRGAPRGSALVVRG